MSLPTSGNYGDDSQIKALGGVRNSITKYDEVITLGIESGNRWLDDTLFPVTLTLPLTIAQLQSATFIVNYHAVMILKQHLNADDTEIKKWEARRDGAFNSLKKKIESQTSQSAKARTYIAKSNYRSINMRKYN